MRIALGAWRERKARLVGSLALRSEKQRGCRGGLGALGCVVRHGSQKDSGAAHHERWAGDAEDRALGLHGRRAALCAWVDGCCWAPAEDAGMTGGLRHERGLEAAEGLGAGF